MNDPREEIQNSLIVLLLLGWFAPIAWAQGVEERFFAGCPDPAPVVIHHEGRWSDPHTVLYSLANLMELEVIRVADLTIDLALPGRPRRPVEGLIKGVRGAYSHLGSSRPVKRVGEFVDALQLRELSLGDAAATYSASSGGSINPGSGTLIRVNKLIDWLQRVVGDVNTAGGRTNGVVRWLAPGRLIDGGQFLLSEIFRAVGVGTARLLDGGVSRMEQGSGRLLGAVRPRSHRRATVFLKIPVAVYRAHELWIARHRRRIYVGPPEALLQLTHAELFHPRPRRGPCFARALSCASFAEASPKRTGESAVREGGRHRGGLEPDPAADGATELVLVTDIQTFAMAPEGLSPYVVPASWVLEPPASSDDYTSGVELFLHIGSVTCVVKE